MKNIKNQKSQNNRRNQKKLKNQMMIKTQVGTREIQEIHKNQETLIQMNQEIQLEIPEIQLQQNQVKINRQ